MRREEMRLRSLFRRAILATAATTLCACGSSDGPAGADSGADAISGQDAMPLADTGVDAQEPPGDGGVDPCAIEQDIDAAAELCGFTVKVPCGLPPGTSTSGCSLTLGDCENICNGIVFYCSATGDSCVDGGITDASPLLVDCATCLGGPGRRPEGLRPPEASPAASALGAYLAGSAHMEAAAVVAFRRMEAELAAFGAPADLTALAARSARDERRHARAVRDLAARHGARPPRVHAARERRRDLETFAAENAAEGCVGETFAALVAWWQAAHAGDGAIAAAMRTIAADETRHAAFAWQVARWAEARLDAGARARVRDARLAAVATLRRQAARDLPASLVRDAGLPPPEAQRALLDTLESDLWTPRGEDARS